MSAFRRVSFNGPTSLRGSCWPRCCSFLVTIGLTNPPVRWDCCTLGWTFCGISPSWWWWFTPRLVSDAVRANWTACRLVVIPAFPVEFLVVSPRCSGGLFSFVYFHFFFHHHHWKILWHWGILDSISPQKPGTIFFQSQNREKFVKKWNSSPRQIHSFFKFRGKRFKFDSLNHENYYIKKFVFFSSPTLWSFHRKFTKLTEQNPQNLH